MKRCCASLWAMFGLTVMLFGAVIMGRAALGAAAEDEHDTPLVGQAIRQAMQEGDYAAAIKAIDAELAVKDVPKDYLTYLKGRAYYLQQQYDRAGEMFDQLEQQFPASAWRRQARFAKALALARKGDFRAAELIYRAEAEYLLSDDRKQQIADIYLEFADRYFKPPKDQQQPDYTKALDFYSKALEVGPKAEKRVAVELRVAECHHNLGNLDQAAAGYERFVREHADSPLEIEARYRLGEVRLAQGQSKAARRVWEDLLAKYKDSRGERVAEAAYNLARTWNIPRPNSSEELELGVAALERFIEMFPAHKLASRAHLEIAGSFVHTGRHEEAIGNLKRFLGDQRYTDCEEVADGRYLLGKCYQLQKKFPEAVAAWQEYIAKHPAHRLWNVAQSQVVSTEFLMAVEKFQAKQYEAARKAIEAFLARYPLDWRGPELLMLVARSYCEEDNHEAAIAQWRRVVSKYPDTDEASRAQYLIAETLERKLGKLEEALEEYRKVTHGVRAPQAAHAIARLTSKTMSIATERVFRSDETPKVRLVSRNIESVSVRAYRVDLETYFRKMHLARGVESLDIALIDPDLSFEFKVPNYNKYQELESHIELPVAGQSKAGVMAVTVSSKTLEATTLVVQSDLDIIVHSSRNEVFVFAQNMLTGKPWQGARLLISDGKQVFAEGATGPDGVFRAQARRPATTDKDKDPLATPEERLAELLSAGDVRVLASSDGHTASNVVDLSGLAVARGLADRGYVYTDRPAYRAGQLVHIRGVLRKAADDVYLVEQGKKYNVQVFDARNRTVHQAAVSLSNYGTFALNFVLPATSPQGQYRILVRDEDGKQSYQGVFQVHQYQLEPVHLVIDTPRRVYYRGEEIEGVIRAAYYYGAPLAGREVRYQLADDRQHTAVTDERGEVKFKLATRDFSETQVLPLVVSLPERNLSTALNIVLAARGFSLAVSTVRPVYVAGETFEATITAADAEGKPIAEKLKLKILEQTSVEGKVGERLVEEYPLETDAATGTTRKTIKLEKGGRYVLRAEGMDRFRNPITGQQSIQISDEEDSVRLRILADAHTLKVGDMAKVQLHWREAPALALVTFQGAKVLDYKLMELKTGANELTIPVTATLAPNFELAVAVMTDPRPDRTSARVQQSPEKEKVSQEAAADGPAAEKVAAEKVAAEKVAAEKVATEKVAAGAARIAAASKAAQLQKPIVRFHQASSPFTVERNLQVSLTLKRKGDAKLPIRPGEEVEVSITTTDPQGKPVSAELSLAMIEQSLLDRFGWQVASIQDAFLGARRQTAMRTTSSITFAYNPPTQAINPRLLAEEDRLALAQEEEESRKLALHHGGQPLAERQPDDRRDASGAVAGEVAQPTEQETEKENLSLMIAQMMEEYFEDEEDGVPGLVYVQLGALGGRGGLGGMGMGGMGDFAHEANEALVQQAAQGQALSSRSRAELRQGTQLAERADRALQPPANGPATAATGPSGKQQDKPQNKLPQEPASAVTAVNGVARRSGDAWAIVDGLAKHTKLDELSFSNVGFFANDVAANSDLLRRLASAGQSQVAVLDSKGNYRNTTLLIEGRWNDARAAALAEELARSGAVLFAAQVPSETAFWAPAVVTDQQGRATLTITLPERSTAWRLLAKGITLDTLAGESSQPLTAGKALFGQLKLPLSVTDGDECHVLASIHNDLVEKGQIEVSLRTVLGDRTIEENKTIEVQGKGIHELSFRTTLTRPEQPKDDKAVGPARDSTVVFQLVVRGGGTSDVEQQSIPLRPYGAPVYAAASGSATSDTTVWLEAPAGMSLQGASMEILVGPTVERSLLDIVLGPATWCQIELARLSTSLDTASSNLMAALALQKLLGGSRQAAGPEAQSLDAAVRSAIGSLVSAQNDDGGWSWSGRGASEKFTSARIVWALSLARKAGYSVPQDCHSKALAYLHNQAAAAAETDYDAKAVLLHALSVAGQGDFALANRLYRNRPALSTGALVYLTLAFVEMDRKPTAAELLELLAQKDFDQSAARGEALPGTSAWSHAAAELRALCALAIQEVTPQSPKAKELVDWLLAKRVGHRWAPEKATGPAAMALARWFAESRFQGERYRLAVYVNDIQVKVLEIDDAALTQKIAVPAAALKKDARQRINFQITGRGRYTFQCVLGGFVPAEKLASTTDQWRVERHYQPAAIEVDGREIPRGFNILEGSYSTFRNPLGQLPVGRRGTVELVVNRSQVPQHVAEGQLEYLVITEPIPAGTTVIEKSVSGGFERFEIGPGEITFYVGSRAYPGTIRYELYGYLPGNYRAAATMVRNAHRPEQLAVATPKSLAVLPQGAASTDHYRLTPVELYELGKHYFNKGDMKQAGAHLAELIGKWKPNPTVYKHAVQMLLDVHLSTGPAGQVVRYFEIIKERWPDEEIPFAKIVKVGAAYHALGEYERAFLVFRATIEGSFLRESRVAGFLQDRGEFLRSVAVMQRLLREYPPEGYAAAAAYALAQQVYAKAPQAAQDEGLRKAKVNRVDLTRRAWSMLESFLTAHPDDPAADQAAFAAANALLELKSYQQCIAACQRYARRYSNSDLLDSYWYVIGYCHFATGNHQAAMEICRKVAEAVRTDKATGRQVESPNKWQAIFILGQVYHSLGQAADAIREYRRVAERFADARQAIDYFLRQDIQLPEVTTVRPGAGCELELKFRNIARCDVKVYRIDLMKFSLLKRNLREITSINLAGIRPYHEGTVQLGDGKDYRDRTHKLVLPLKEQGAYLVVCRGDDLHANGLVLISPLAVEVQEELASGRVRATVKDIASDRYVRDAHVKIIGSRNEDFVAGTTDLRGVFVADGIKGTTTVIAQVDTSRYAFFRGNIDLVPEPPAPKRPPAAQPSSRPGRDGRPASLEDSLLENVKGFNKALQDVQVEQLKRNYQNEEKGVRAKAAF